MCQHAHAHNDTVRGTGGCPRLKIELQVPSCLPRAAAHGCLPRGSRHSECQMAPVEVVLSTKFKVKLLPGLIKYPLLAR